MEKKVAVRLLPNWEPMDNPGGPATFVRGDLDQPGVLQVSLSAEYESGEVPNPTAGDLIELAAEKGRGRLGEPVEVAGGACELGRFGLAVFTPPGGDRWHVWYLSNGYDFLLATFIKPGEPDPIETAEAAEIVFGLTLKPGRKA